jgi:hypothetical protein
MRWQQPLCIVEASNKAEALKIAREYHEVYNNQFLEAVPTSKAKRRHLDEVYINSWAYKENTNIKVHPQIIATVEPWELF